MLGVLAPAKINLTLEVLAKRPDGFHEIRSVIQAIGLYDHIRFNLSRRVEFRCGRQGWIAGKSLVSKAVSRLRETTGYTGGVTVEIEKHIPLLSGLGGDSSGAAATLRGLDRLWGLGLSFPELVELASQLGSDVSFFLYGGTALLKGRGELVMPLPVLPRMWVILVVPPVFRMAGKTARLYASLKPSHYTDGGITEKFIEVLGELKPEMLFNTFENVAFDRFAGLKVYKEHLIKLGAPHVHLAGSGPALFSLINDKEEAEELYTCYKDQGLECYLAETI